MFKKLFGGGGSSSKPSGAGPSGPPPGSGGGSVNKTVNAIQSLGETEELLSKRRDLLEKKIAAELERAKQLTKAGNKRAALMALKKKKLYESQLEQVENSILRVSEQQMTLENMRVTAETIGALKQGTDANKATMQEMKIDDVDRVLDDINDQADQMRQIQDALGQPLGFAGDIDEDELAAELEDIEAAQVDEMGLEMEAAPQHKVAGQAAPAAALPDMPSAPAAPPKKPKTPEEEELEALQAELAG